MECKVAGISFTLDATPQLALARPSGPVVLKHEPFVHPQNERFSDPFAVRVYWDGTAIGYLPKAGPEREAAWEHHAKRGAFPPATVKDYSYKPPGTNDFNHDHNGVLASVLIDIDLAGEAEGKRDGDFEFYHKDGKQYNRLSNVMDAFDPDGSRAIEGNLTKWMIDAFDTHDDYLAYMRKTADDGDRMHAANELACKAGVVCAKSKAELEKAVEGMEDSDFAEIKEGFWNFIANECAGLSLVETETTVYDDAILVAGTFDALFKDGAGKKIVVDWKSAKAVRPDHIIKTCFYATHAGAEEAWVVAFGSKNKCGYQLKKAKKVAIANGYQIVKWVSIARDFVGDLNAALKAGE